jgi:hypothetical protein
MKKSLTMIAFLSGVVWLGMSRCATAQNGVSGQPLNSAPVVSPFLNLGYNTNGLSNYQSLVKPMIDERSDLMRQSANLQQLQRQVRNGQGVEDPTSRGRGARSQGAVRFMHYSHFYDGLRSTDR